MTTKEENILKKLALELRLAVLHSIFMAGSGHPGSSLSCLDIILYLYKKILNVNCKNPKDLNRDRFVLSKGHAAPALYAVLAECGFFSSLDLLNLRKFKFFLQGHPNLNDTPGVDMSTGSLGQGVSAACGMAAGLRLNGLSSRVYCLIGDGELQEGQVFEAFCFASHNKLDNLCFIVDNNGLQIDGTIEEVAGFLNIPEKLKSFGLNVILADGHSFNDLEKAFKTAKEVKEKPSVVLAKTIKGKGVSFMQNSVGWHGKAPNEEEFYLAKEEIVKALKKFEGE